MMRFATLTLATCTIFALVSSSSAARAQAPPGARIDPAPDTNNPTSQPLPGGESIERLTAPANGCPCPPVEGPGVLALPSLGGPLLERPTLTGDWFGLRTRLRDRGITFDISSTQYYQGVAAGGLRQEFAYGGRNDYYFHLDGEKLSLWKGSHLHLHGETRYGESPNFITGALSPVNEYLLVPGKQGLASGLTAAKFTQFFSEDTLAFAGKINLLDEMVQPLTGAHGLEGFQNISLIFNPILARTLPYSTFGVGIIQLKDGHPFLAFSVFDTHNAATTSVFDRLFENGAVLFATVILPTNFFGLPGHQGIEGSYSSGRYTNIAPSPYLDPVNELVFAGPPKAGSWAVGYLFDQAFWVSPDDRKRKWGLFGRFGIADDNPNPVHWSASAGVSGASPIANRQRDTFGAGYFYIGVSDALKQNARSISPLRDEQGVELYYNARITPWFQFTPDLQIIVPFQKQADTALVLGLRARLDF